MVGRSEGSKKKQSCTQGKHRQESGPRGSINRRWWGVGVGSGWGTGGKMGLSPRAPGLSQAFACERRFHQICGGPPASPIRCGRLRGGGPQAQVVSEAVRGKRAAREAHDGTHTGRASTDDVSLSVGKARGSDGDLALGPAGTELLAPPTLCPAGKQARVANLLLFLQEK